MKTVKESTAMPYRAFQPSTALWLLLERLERQHFMLSNGFELAPLDASLRPVYTLESLERGIQRVRDLMADGPGEAT